MLRPISPIAWIPIAILWFGVGNVSPIFLIFISSVFPMIVQTTAGVHTIERRYLRAAENFGVSRADALPPGRDPRGAAADHRRDAHRPRRGVARRRRRGDDRAALRARLSDHRLAQRGNRYDLVIAGMIIIGLIGLLLDGVMRLLEGLKVGAVALCALRSKSATSGRASPPTRARCGSSTASSFDGRRRRVRRDRRPLRLRQDDAAEHHRRLRCGPIRARSPIDGAVRDGPSPKGIVISQHGSVFPWLTVRQNLMFGLNGHARARQGRARRSLRRDGRARRASRRAIRTSCRAAC